MTFIKPACCFFLVSLLAGAVQAQTTVYVDPNAPGLQNGTSWQDAYHGLQDALTAAVAGTVVRVADGTYSPGPGSTDSFELKREVVLEGGYAGYGAPDPDERDISLYPSVLDGNDINDHVVTGTMTDRSTVVDGFTITRGNGGDNNVNGGGLLLLNSEIELSNCTFSDNSGAEGGGMSIENGGGSVLTQCTFTGNYSKFGGGGLRAWNNDSIALIDCTFSDNTTLSTSGGGAECHNGSTIVTQCTFSNNVATRGGGIWIYWGEAAFTDCLFLQNKATNPPNVTGGGGLYGENCSSLDVKHCTFIENSTTLYGGGLSANSCDSFVIESSIFIKNKAADGPSNRGGGVDIVETDAQIINCVFSRNASIAGGGATSYYGQATLTNCTFSQNSAGYGAGFYDCYESATITNCVFHDDGPDEINDYGTSPSVVTYSCVRGGYAGEGNIAEDPGFIDPSNDDLHLTRLSPCINRGTNGGAPLIDLDGDPRPLMGTTDMGADEFAGAHLLSADLFQLSVQGGGIALDLETDASQAGRLYAILGSLSGTAPGIPIPGGSKNLPLNFDSFTEKVLVELNGPIFVDFMASLGPDGSAAAYIHAPQVRPTLVGKVMHYAYLLDGPPWDIISNPVAIEFVP